uniref:Uncharacterized protein n=1 Tax=Oryza sativa subsp. japonica TaxID=39947 RepID=Q8GRR0_ORYSJ|nr:hypothetical protein [Oryza sativa Japonica Group]BAD30252.1 hypothetical protein [Oryza sativa Japonica Group]
MITYASASPNSALWLPGTKADCSRRRIWWRRCERDPRTGGGPANRVDVACDSRSCWPIGKLCGGRKAAVFRAQSPLVVVVGRAEKAAHNAKRV